VAGSSSVQTAPPARSASRAPLVIATVLAVAAAIGWTLSGSLRPAFEPNDLLPAIGLLAVFLAAESTQLHLEFRRQTHSTSASEIPLVFGLFLVQPGTLLLVRLAAAALVMIIRRRPPIKTWFNLCLFAAETTLAVVTFHAALQGRPADITDPRSWVATAAAVAVAVVVSNAGVFAVIISSGAMPSWRETAVMAAPAFLVTPLNSAVALVVLLTLSVSDWAVVLLAVVGGMFVLGYRGWLRSRKQHAVLGRVYRFSRLLEQVRGMDGPLEVALQEARGAVNAEIVRLGVLSEDGDLIVTEVSDGPTVTRAGLQPDALAQRVLDSRGGLRLDRRKAPESLLAALQARDADEILAVPLRSGSKLRGYLELQDRQGEMSSFSAEDLALVENLGAHLTAAVENKDLVARLRHAAYHDLLTGLPTRTRLGQHLESAIDEGGDGVVALVQLDLDRFKEVNDSLGHTWGDELLVLVGQRLTRKAPEGAMVARVGADEFAVVGRVSGPKAAAELASVLRDAVSTSYPLAGLTIDASATAGVALAPDHGDDAPTLMRRVDVALSNAKNIGRHTSMYDPSMEQESLQRLRLVTELRAALASGQVVVRYQPKINLRSRELVGVEARSTARSRRTGSCRWPRSPG
jgi:diguanylate cyclase (GGDEF)-like protein